MSARALSARFDLGLWLLPAGLAALAALLGVVAGARPALAVAAAIAAALLLVALNSLRAGLVGFIALSFVGLLPSLGGPTLSLTKVAGLVLALSWFAGVASGQYRRLFPSAHPLLTFLLVAFLAWNAISITWAEDPSTVQPYVLAFLLAFMLFPIVYSAVDSTRTARMVVLAFIAGAAVTSLYGVVTQPRAAALASSPSAASGLSRLSGTVGDPNELATLLVAGVALSGAIVFNRDLPTGLRVAALSAASVMLIGVFLTLSRGGLVALAALILCAMLFAGRRYRARIIVIGAAVVASGLVFFFGVASPEARERITAADGGNGRTDIWQVGWRIVEEEPVQGVGAANFQVSAIHYLVAPGAIRSDEFLVDAPSVVHNSYLQILSETGIPGLALYLLIVAGCIACAIAARRNFLRRADQGGELLAIALLAAIGGMLAGNFFLSEESSKHLWLLLALAPALLGVSQRGEDDAAAEAQP